MQEVTAKMRPKTGNGRKNKIAMTWEELKGVSAKYASSSNLPCYKEDDVMKLQVQGTSVFDSEKECLMRVLEKLTQ